ncbi:hypothetical protein HHL28_17795 [Aerophototrophica crusticola]|uniref:DUF2846 domain-containing protein n=1 Tax=Aerophototrophica crusticola TaxID=1709002 RepID=A0A858RCL7_9PROT|nr:hypothetical protein HHL28_17795 [Rhodospirillaceae bacterium B3]
MTRLVVLLFALLLGGCANVASSPTGYKGADAGYVALMASAASNNLYPHYIYKIRRRGDQTWSELLWRYDSLFSAVSYDIDTPQEKGSIVLETLAPGDYTFFDVSLFTAMGAGYGYISQRVPFEVNFTVRPGEVTYIGHYVAHSVKGRSIFGISAAAGAVYAVRDGLEGDRKHILAKLPTPLPITAQVPDPRALNHPALRPADAMGPPPPGLEYATYR